MTEIVDETNPSGALSNEYIFFGGQRIARRDPSSNVFYYFSDHLGTARSIAEVPSGQTTATKCYDADLYPFGGERWYTDTCDSHFKFTGKERDPESGLDNFGARYNSSSLGRFMSPDPLLNSGQPWDPQTWNRYAYALNNPLAIIDPTGLYNLVNNCAQDDKKCNKQFQQAAKKLKQGLSDLQKKVDKMKPGKEKDRLSAALNRMGTENDGNNVNVQFGTVTGGAAHTDLTLDNSGNIKGFTVTFDPSKISDDAGYAINGAHEGTHMDNYLDPRYRSGGLSDFSDEYRAYETSAWAAQALGLPSWSYGNGQFVIWNSSWKEADRRETNMDKGITGEILDHYHYPETIPHDPWPEK